MSDTGKMLIGKLFCRMICINYEWKQKQRINNKNATN